MPLKRRAAPRAEIMGWDGSAWQRLPVESSTNPNLRVGIYEGANEAEIETSGSDGKANTINQLVTGAMRYGFNGSTWDRWRNNTEVTVLPSATRTTSGSSAAQTNYNARGVIVFVEVTAVSGTAPTLDIYLSGRDPTTGSYKYLAKLPQITAAGSHQLLVYPGATDIQAYIEGKNDIPLPRIWGLTYVIGGTNPSFTFSAGAIYIV